MPHKNLKIMNLLLLYFTKTAELNVQTF